MPAGRPSKLTPEVQERIIDTISKGNYKEVAAQVAGITVTTFCDWMKRFPEFAKAVQEAEVKAEADMVAHVKLAAQNDPVHGRWWLERKFPERWGRRDKMAVSGPDGEAVLVKIETVVTDATAKDSPD